MKVLIMSSGSSAPDRSRTRKQHCSPGQHHISPLAHCLYPIVNCMTVHSGLTSICAALASAILVLSLSLVTFSTAQTIASTPTIIPLVVPRDHSQYNVLNQQPQQQIVYTQQPEQTQSRQKRILNSPANRNSQISTSLPGVSLQSTDHNTLAPTVWRGLPSTANVGILSTGSTLPTSSPIDSFIRNGPTLITQQPKSLKFTLIAGKFWKFNVTTNSLNSSHKAKELRLHRNISSNNFIIDDDGWFQYNHQQQQLFAWPSLSTTPATYYFVLLPSGLDFEADGENVINSGDVVANIIVELLPPLFKKIDTDEIDQFIDHKYTLEYLHRHQSYPLLLSQIVAIFEILSKNNKPSSNSHQVNNLNQSTFTSEQAQAAGTRGSILAAIQQNKQSRSLKPLSEYLLINSSATSDGEFFSLTWTIHPSLVNNTIVPIDECRLSLINDTVSKLSCRSILYPTDDDKFVVSYALEGPLVNSNTIVPTERGNYALQLTLNKLCRQRRFVEELGLTSISGIYVGITELDKENIIPEQSTSVSKIQNQTDELIQLSTASSVASITSTTITTKIPASSDSVGFVTDATPPKESTTFVNLPPKQFGIDSNSTENELASHTSTRSISSKETISSTQVATTLHAKENTTTGVEHDFKPLSPLESTAKLSNTTSVSSPSSTSKSTPHGELLLDKQTPALKQISEAPILIRNPLPVTQSSVQQHQQSFKSLAKFLDHQPDVRSIDTKAISELTLVNSTSLSMDPNLATYTTIVPTNSVRSNSTNGVIMTPTTTINPTASGSEETSLNEDLIGILNEVMEYLVSVAVPIAIIVGILLLLSILIALCNLCMKKKKSKKFDVGDRFKFRYGSERRHFLRNSSKPVILEVDQKSLSMGGSPQHRSSRPGRGNEADYQKMSPLKSNDSTTNDAHMTTSFASGKAFEPVNLK